LVFFFPQRAAAAFTYTRVRPYVPAIFVPLARLLGSASQFPA
jgi:hypothetical protein